MKEVMSVPPKALVLIKTSTEEKIKLYQAAANAKNLPLMFADLRFVAGPQHVVSEEEGTSEANNKVKFGPLSDIRERFLKPDSKEAKNLQALKSAYGIDKNAPVLLATEDSEGGVDIKHFNDMPTNRQEAIKARLPDFVRKNLEDGRLETFPGADLAPIMLAYLGQANTLNGLADNLIGWNFPHTELTTMRLLGMDGKAFQPITKHQTMNLNLTKPADLGATIYDRLSFKPTQGKSMVASSLEYLCQHSPRAQIVDELASTLNITPIQGWSLELPERSRVEADDFIPKKLVSQYTLKGPLAEEQKKNKNKAKSADTKGAIALATFMAERLKQTGDVIDRANVLWFQPQAENSQLTKEEKDAVKQSEALMLSSAVVARQLNVREANKPFIIINHNNVYDDVLASFAHFVNLGMCKEYTNGFAETKENLSQLGTKHHGVTHTSGLYFDVLSGSNLEALTNAGKELLEEARKHYLIPPAAGDAPPALESRGSFAEAVENGKDIFKVGVFMSASSENLEVNGSTKEFGAWLAKRGMGVVYGAGDRYTMGALLEGYKESGGTYIAGFSTPEIILSETKEGKFSNKLDYGIVNQDIYERMAQMIALSDDAIVVRPGGAGTYQEMAAVLLMKTLFKDVPAIANKKLIILNETLQGAEEGFYTPVLKQLLGDEAYAQKTLEMNITDGHSANFEDGVYIAQSQDQVKNIVGTLKERWEKKVKKRKTRAREKEKE